MKKQFSKLLLTFLCIAPILSYAHTMKNFSITDKSYADFQKVEMTIVNGDSEMDYEIIVDGKVLGNIGMPIPPRREFAFEVELPTPPKTKKVYEVCSRSLPKDNSPKTTVCGEAELTRN